MRQLLSLFSFIIIAVDHVESLTGHQLEFTTPPEDPAAVRAVGARALAEH